jgi:hypothetical protein
MPPPGWQNPITVAAGQFQVGMDPLSLLPSRNELHRARLGFQRRLVQLGTPRLTPIQVTTEGVIFDGHHAVRVAAENGTLIEVKVIDFPVPATADSILDLPVV